MVTEIRCSQLARPMVCAGSMFFTNLPPQEETAPAKEGTAAGEYLERLLTRKDLPPSAKNGVPFDSDMMFHTMPIADRILELKVDVACEQQIDWRTRSGIMIKGQYDISYVHEGTLYIEDLKYGWGIVEVVENWQLLGYAIGEVIRRGQAFKKIVLRICQPRPHHENGPMRDWVLTYDQLLHYKERIERRMEEIVNGHRELVTSEKCKYCPAAAMHCTAFNRSFYRGIEVSQEFTQDEIDEKELSFQLDLVARASEILKIKSDSLKALALDRIKQGKIIPGYVTEESYGDRKWKTGVSAKAIEMLTGKSVIEQVMLSPAKAEKVGVSKDLIKGLVDRHFLGNKLVKKDSTEIGNKIFGKGNL